ncbi:MAG TPA: metallophosphoesterase family protein [Desulfosarcina sp.]|nr:metallophosphoesterase family protein [Desulfosarcina sp.]
MKTFAVLSDIHGNLEAFEAVLRDIASLGIETTYSLGDNIGYGPDPEAVIQRLAALAIPSVLGNHELAVIDPSELDWFNPVARESLRKTVAMLSEASLDVIHRFPYCRVQDVYRFVHGFPPDSPVIYQFQVDAAEIEETFAALPEQVFFTGHTHFPEMIAYRNGRIEREDLHQGVRQLEADARYIVNVGSVGQPRDGNNCAKYVVFDPERPALELRYVPYEVEAVVAKILAAGLPESHATRLR